MTPQTRPGVRRWSPHSRFPRVSDFVQTPLLYERRLWEVGSGATERCHARCATLPLERGRVAHGGQRMPRITEVFLLLLPGHGAHSPVMTRQWMYFSQAGAAVPDRETEQVLAAEQVRQFLNQGKLGCLQEATMWRLTKAIIISWLVGVICGVGIVIISQRTDQPPPASSASKNASQTNGAAPATADGLTR
jgi:hypothetical protein